MPDAIPYNYGKYIDDQMKIKDTGTIDSDQQIASPSSAGSRGLAQTTQFTNDKTQMQLGQEAIAESMVEIRSILNRIDGVNAPVQEAESDYLYLRGKEIDQGSIMYKMEDYSDGIFELQSAKYADGTELDEKELEELESTQELIDWVMIDFVSEHFIGRRTAGQERATGYYKNPDKEFNINGMTTKKDVVQSIIDNLDNNELDTARDSLNQLLDVVTALHDDYQPMPEGDEFDIEEDEDFEEVLGALGFPEDETELFDAEYQGRKVPLNKPMRGDSKKFKVYVKDPKTGNVKKVNFGHGGTSAKRKTMRIRKSNPKARKSFRARHNCANPGPKTKARYWSCRKW